MTNLTSDFVHNIREQMAVQSAYIGASHQVPMRAELRMSPAQIDRLTATALAAKLSIAMAQYARNEVVPFLDVDITKMVGESSDKTRIEVVAVHPALWARISIFLRDLELELSTKP
jgi:hypothetical protein